MTYAQPVTFISLFSSVALGDLVRDTEEINQSLQSETKDFATTEKEEVFGNFYQKFREFSVEDWDGYGAKKISPDSLSAAYLFLCELNTMVDKMPIISATPEGEFLFYWADKENQGKMLSIIFEGEVLHFAFRARDKRGNKNGTLSCTQNIPAEILNHIAEVTR